MAEKKTGTRKSAPKQLAAANVAQKTKKKAADSVKYKQKEDYEGEDEKGKEAKQSRNRSSDSARSKGTKQAPKERVNVFEESERNRKMVHQMMPYVLMVLSLFIVMCFLLMDVLVFVNADRGVGVVGKYIHDVLCGLFGPGAFFVPVAIGLLAIGWRGAVQKNALLAKNLYAFFSVVMVSTLLHVLLRMRHPIWADGVSFADAMDQLWGVGVSLDGGGAIGGFLGELFYKGIGLVGAVIVTVVFAFVLVVFLCGLTPSYVLTAVRYRQKLWREKQAEISKVRREERAVAKAEAAEEAKMEKQARREQMELEAAERRAKKEQLELEAAERKAKMDKAAIASEPVAQKAEEDNRPVIIVPASDGQEEKRIYEVPKEERTQTEAPAVIIPQDEESHTKKEQPEEKPAGEKKSAPIGKEDDGVYYSAEDIFSSKGNDEISLSEIFSSQASAPTESEKEKVPRTATKTAEAAGKASEDMALLAQMREITDLDEFSGVEDDIEEIEIEPEEVEAEYVFPPITMLAEDKNDKEEDVTAELVANAQKLMDTLKSFKVGIKEITYSRGPTITRYELKPDVGIRVRSIANLVDDIALSLATTGVRIEAPIPNKPAVGIEVPNKNANTVYLRSLIDTEKFESESSKLTACLGADVAGKPMYFNIAKMPHLLIAGATGMGKSVCINSIIVSLLYKARPDEVKLILIDPKKVEFNIYKDIPHLYAPIVSEPTKAAGALASAVAEMERRFELIEEVGVRDIYNYNAVTKDDPDREFMPQMVIIIDELADLMMTAADSVESSICRLAQKARAAGIHIIIGTQRPSVDVITGLIKANVPSRIAFTVASQVDSRTIIDIAGAEKLIGRGDMLFAPVGSAKPMRVQGAFVSENEVEKIVEFIKANNRTAKYNDEFMSRIEEEAAKCASGNKKGGGASLPDGDMDSDGLDPKFREAVKVAVETGRVATSLLQRKLEIGYGRAAKIIDQMEERGYVSAAEGNKPRKILISKEDFMQMTINDDI